MTTAGVHTLTLRPHVRARDPSDSPSQQGQIDQAQETGVDIVASARAAYDDLSAQLGAAQEDASQAADEAAEAQDQAESAATCARSFVSAFGLIFSGATLQEGVDAAVAELQALQPQCAPALG